MLKIFFLFSAGHRYRVTVSTGDRPGAGTSAGVFVVLCGGPKCETSGKLWLDNGQRALLPGQRDTFVVTSPKLVSPPQSLTVAHDNTGPSPGWFLEEVRGHQDHKPIAYCNFLFPVHL